MIAAMAPTLNTLATFGKLVEQTKTPLIVQLCPEEENSKVGFEYCNSLEGDVPQLL